MACSLKSSFFGSWCNETISSNVATTGLFTSKDCGIGKSVQVSDFKDLAYWNAKPPVSPAPIHAQGSVCISRGLRWWEKTKMPNMMDIDSAQQLVDTLSSAGDKLVIVDFYSPGCGGCKTLHPKICQLAESNPNAIFLRVNYEELKLMCYSLHIHVLPFFRFYRGSQGRVCSFSCTTSTIKKFKDAMTKYGKEGYSSGPAKGLDESELFNLASNGLISPNLPLQANQDESKVKANVSLA